MRQLDGGGEGMVDWEETQFHCGGNTRSNSSTGA
jgi:hypothetical protein